MRVYLIRHGQTEGNLLGFHQGWGDIPLTDTGIAQAEALKILISDVKFDRIISSDIYRARQTAGILFGADLKIEYDGRLREINNSALTGMTRDQMYKIHGEKYIADSRLLDYSDYGGESAASMLERTAGFLAELEGDTASERIAVVTHGGAIHAMLSRVLSMPLYLPKLRIENCSVTKLRFDDGAWSVGYINKTAERTAK